MSSVYYNPEDYGLELIGLLEDPNLSYEFNMLAVFRDIHSNRIYMGKSSGCSCPTPFEEFQYNKGVTNLTPLDRYNIHVLNSAVEGFPVSSSERMKFIDKISKYLYEPNDILKDSVYGKP